MVSKQEENLSDGSAVSDPSGWFTLQLVLNYFKQAFLFCLVYAVRIFICSLKIQLLFIKARGGTPPATKLGSYVII